MSGKPPFEQARSISFDFDGVLSTLIMGRRWVKTKAHKRNVPLVSPLIQSLKRILGVLTQGWRAPFPHADEVLRELRASKKALSLLTSRTGGSIDEARHWLDRFGLIVFFDELFFNVAGEDADLFKARILRETGIDVHIDDDPETLAYLSGEFPERLFIHLNGYGRESLTAANVVTVRSWQDLPGILCPDARAPRAGQKE